MSFAKDNFSFSGFLLNHYSARITGNKSDSGDFLAENLTLRLENNFYTEKISTTTKLDFIHSALDKQTKTDFREVYIDYALNNLNLTFGKQIATWGIGDLIFINDIFPKNYSAFFTGNQMDYLKKSFTAIKLNLNSGKLNWEGFILPTFTEDTLPANNFFYYNPFSQITNIEYHFPAASFKNTELAFKTSTQIKDLDLALYFYKGFYRQPFVMPDDFVSPTKLTYFYPQLFNYGLTLQKSLFSGIFGLESGYYYFKEDKNGDNPTIPNSQIKFLLSYQKPINDTTNISLQYYGELMQKYENYKTNFPASFPLQKKLKDVATLRFSKNNTYQTKNFSLFAFYSLSDNDFYLIPEASFNISDYFSYTLGFNIFGGVNDKTFFAQFNKNGNIYLRVKVNFN